jgi:serine/arginine repetitive matrix protein 2
MYAGDGKPAISVGADVQLPDTPASNPSALHSLEPGATVEVPELANGETIWLAPIRAPTATLADEINWHPHARSTVSGLRDDEDSLYGNRASFVSEYSLRDEGVQVFFKEHGRTGSKDSQSSFLSRKKATTTTQGPKRPETKVRRIFKIQMEQGCANPSSTVGLLQFVGPDRTPH